eukprot:TRINITY_DN2290_c0_g1_i2.p1 TRINITY_DN2290_c0_g1~~TRINITY_DN2290_c0_g1_i2.p1  ORF type:complete len:955 (+),score=336.28 TRINITY_DN2290_c0_g1_i2:60-2867(+)
MSFFSKITGAVSSAYDSVDKAITEAQFKAEAFLFEDMRESPFARHKSCRITLFQDAHNGEDAPPKIIMDDGSESDYEPPNAFEDMYSSMLNARRFIYITGWSVDTKISLLRRRDIYPEEDWPVPSARMTVGELLKYKASQGVKVMVHVWDEALSMNLGGMSLGGVMNTCDEETAAYFKGTGVEVKLSYRTGTSADNQILWSHHQKTIIVDAPLKDTKICFEQSTVPATLVPQESQVVPEQVMPDGGDIDPTILWGPTPSGRRYLRTGFMTCEHRYTKMWDDRKTAADPHMLAIFRPHAPDGYHILGDFAERSHAPFPGSATKIIVVAEPPVTDDSLPPMLAEPTGYNLVWDGSGIGAWPKSLQIWEPVPPDGYRALGHVAGNDGVMPPNDVIRCVHESALVPAFPVRESDGMPIWRDRKTHCKFGDLAIWPIRPLTEGLVLGTWMATPGYDCPSTPFFTILAPPAGVHVADKDYDGIDESEEFVTSTSRAIIPSGAGQCGRRRIIAFVGGLDITGGRWDNPSHRLFRSLGTDHADDYYMPWGLSGDHGPRQPWHDIHGKVEGPIARDLLVNFEQRWRKQAQSPLYHLGPEFISLEQEEAFIREHTPEPALWEARLCRSIDPYSADIPNLERGIQYAYVKAIRSAKRFIYIENQYFLGSASRWLRHSDVPCLNLIPYEIADRIVKAIKDDEDFMCYVVMPYFPEGDPATVPLQEIMRWQHHTQEMMYHVIAKEIAESDHPERNPTYYLNFFCLGNRETEEGATPPVAGPPPDTLVREKALYESRRFLIYVHSKMMIVDDDYIIWGSANINDRSLKGDRDTEIAVEAWQPHFRREDQPRGHIHRFRMSLWAEHTNRSVPEFLAPNTPECVQLMRGIGSHNLEAFTGDETVDLESHLLRYPIDVAQDGALTCNPPIVPDTPAEVRGRPSTMLPDNLTT